MTFLIETDDVAIYIGLDHILFVLSNNRACPHCGRSALIFFRRKNGDTQCIGCSRPDAVEDTDNAMQMLVV